MALICLHLPAVRAWAQDAEPPSDRDARVQLRIAIKGTGLFSQPSREGLWRIRIEPRTRLGAGATFEFAYEQRTRFTTGTPAISALALLPADAPPYRLTPLDWELSRQAHSSWRHEIDRAVVHVPVSRFEFSAGRQAVGWGRGVLFGAVDLFSPFSPFEIDREWRRGIDAFRFESRLTDRSSAEMVLAFGGSPDRSIYAGRVRGYAGEVDFEVAAGRRASDRFGAAASSFVLGPAEIHLELAAFRAPKIDGSTLFGNDRTVWKSVMGGSYRVAAWGGIFVHAEYHYSGFGVGRAEDLAQALTDPGFLIRVSRGDTQIVTRHAVAVLASYEWSPVVSGSAAVVQNPVDGSGIITPTLTLTFGDRWSLVAAGYLSYGQKATGGIPRSTYGDAPRTAVVQVRFYR